MSDVQAAIRNDPQDCDALSASAPADTLQPAVSISARLRRQAGGLFGAGARQGTLSVADQSIASGVNFLTNVLIGRICGPAELGIYALGFSLVVICYSVLQSLISIPYSVFAARLHGRPRAEYAGAVLVHYVLFSLLAALAMLGGAAAVAAGLKPRELLPVLCVLAATVPFILLREFARRVCFAHLHTARALAIDIAAAVFQAAGLLLLIWAGKLSAVTATLLVGLACAAPAVIWLVANRKSFVVRRDNFATVARQNWTFGGWMFAGGLLVDFSSSTMVLWILTFTVDRAAAGVFAATATLVRVCNPFISGIAQMLVPKVAEAYGREAEQGARRVVWKTSAFLGITMGAFWVALFFGGQAAVNLLYGSKYAGYEHVILILALSALASALTLAPAAGLQVLQRPAIIFKADVVQAIVTLVVAGGLVVHCGVLGVVYGLLAGQVVGLAIQWASFSRLARGKVA
jgi:O-antigen/teichoic acid export membrane protein